MLDAETLKMKQEMALKLLKAGVASREIRKRTKKKFGAGIGQGYLTAIRKEIDAKRAPEKTDLKKAMKKYNKAQRKLLETHIGLPEMGGIRSEGPEKWVPPPKPPVEAYLKVSRFDGNAANAVANVFVNAGFPFHFDGTSVIVKVRLPEEAK